MISCEPDFIMSPQESGSFQQTAAPACADPDISFSPPVLPFNVTACSSSDDSHSSNSRPSKLTSYNNSADILPISISSVNANRMLEASRAFNLALRNVERNEGPCSDVSADKTIVQNEGHYHPPGYDPPVIKAQNAESDYLYPVNDVKESRIMNFSRQHNRPIQKLFVQAVHHSKHPLLEAFLRQMRGLGMTDVEIEACLLLFADMGKSSKILAGFEILATERDSEKTTSESPFFSHDSLSNAQLEGTHPLENRSAPRNDVVKPAQLSCAEIKALLQCFMTSISICMDAGSKDQRANEPSTPSHEDNANLRPSKFPRKSSHGSPDSSPTANVNTSTPSLLHDDWTLSESILKEIRKIASFASLQIMEFVQKKYQYSPSSDVNDPNFVVGFDQFGEWYNSGGFSSVPWLELLDLNKWDFERRETSTQASPPFVDENNGINNSDNFNEKRPLSDMTESRNDHCSPYFSERKSEPTAISKPIRTLISFDFSDGGRGIKITEENLIALQRLVQLTCLENRTSEEILGVLLRFSTPRNYPDSNGKMILHRSDFGRCIRLIVPLEVSMHFSSTDAELISLYFSNFFNCFSYSSKEYGLNGDYVDAIELTIGLSFFCKGKKSSKLASTFEMLDEKKTGSLDGSKILRYIRSYLLMLAGISLLSSSSDIPLEQLRIQLSKPPAALLEAAHDGARWTLDHFIKSLNKSGQSLHKDEYSFESFAGWYTNGGYNFAPWLEFLDLKKFFSLLSASDKESKDNHQSREKIGMGEADMMIPPTDGSGIPSVSGTNQPSQSSQVLFSFPLANRQSLVVLKEDASYVYTVVTSLALVNFSPEDMWRSLWRRIRSLSHIKPGPIKTFELDKTSFVTFVSDILGDRMNTKSSDSLSSIKETIGNFYLSFDLDQKNRVAANQLMGGLTLLCQGKKSTKLSFSFGLFDGSNDDIDISMKSQSLDGRELFYFLRSFLIVMFSCCKQSLQLSSAAVARNISDTAYTVTDNVMRYQWRTKAKSRVDFDEFGEWYNQGGFEAAPWLELLDLSKWALRDKVLKTQESKSSPTSLQTTFKVQAKGTTVAARSTISQGGNKILATTESLAKPMDIACPPPPPDDHFDPNADDFFDDNIAMDGIDDYDFDFNDISDGLCREPIGPITTAEPSTSNVCGNPLNFQILSGQDHGGFLVNVSSRRVALLRRVLSESKLCHVDVSTLSNIIMSKATNKKLTKDNFMATMKNIPLASGTSEYSKKVLNELYLSLFDAFDVRQTGKVDAKLLVCGCTVVCHGRKSDKLEFSFDLLEKGQVGLSQTDMIRYLESFLNVLLTVSSCPLGGESAETVISSIHGASRKSTVPQLPKVAHIGCSWAAAQVFNSEIVKRSGSERISFETFASWYTTGGYSNIPWLELLDLRKWILAADNV